MHRIFEFESISCKEERVRYLTKNKNVYKEIIYNSLSLII